MEDIKTINIEELRPHPDNPRLFMREDIIESITNQLRETGKFDPAHAILVRPQNGHYQIIQGHHRIEAAKQAGMSEIPAWVREMSDDEAYMQLALGNTEDGLRPLEIGVHAFKLPDRSLREYARQLGYKDSRPVRRYRRAAEVLHYIKCGTDASLYVDKALHLDAIFDAPKRLWSKLVRLMLKEGWSSQDARYKVEWLLSLKISEKWEQLFLPLGSLLEEDLSSKQIAQLISLAEGVEAMIHSYDVDHRKYLHAFWEWLELGIGGYSWDVRQLVDYQRQLQKVLAEAECKPASIAKEDWQTWITKQKDCDLLLTDPPYMTDIEDIEAFAAEWLPVALNKVKVTGRAYVCIGAYPKEIKAYLNVKIPSHMKLSNILVWTYRNTLGPSPSEDYKLNWQAILYFKGRSSGLLNCPVMVEQFTVQDINAPDGRLGNRFHAWQKPDELAERLISHSTQVDDVVLDPFAGTGTFLVVASKLGRVARGCDIDPEMVRIAIERGCVSER